MPLTIGTRLGPYEIVTPLGAGGMGEVYRARDTRLDRVVAVKVLPTHLSLDPDLKQRFEREARAISSLQHPNICVLHDIGSDGGVDFIVMEYLEGETLADRLARGPLPIRQAVSLGVDIASALDKAHRAGIVHRDLKPGNIMLVKGGAGASGGVHAKLLDFGLAKPIGAGMATESGAPLLSAAVTVASPTPHRSPLTSAGSVVGTMQYMAPEQLEGKNADARADLFALGAVLYEMVTGRRAFGGKSQLSVATAILESTPPPLHTVIPAAPAALQHAIDACLAKDRDDRIQSAHDLMLELRWIAEGPADAAPDRAHSGRGRLIAGLVAGAAILAAAAAGYVLAPRGASTRVMRTLIEPPEKLTFESTGDFGGAPVLSRDGDKIVFTAHGPNSPRALWLRALDSFSAIRLEGTEGGYMPFWSPDGRTIAFFANGKLASAPAAGGAVTVIADAPNPRGGTWGKDDVMLFAAEFQGPIVRTSARGGQPVAVTSVDPARHTTHRWPWLLPDGRHFLYLATNHTGGRPDQNGVYYASLDGKENRLLVASDAGGQYASGYLLFHSGGALAAQRFDPDAGVLSGEPMVLVDRIRHDSGVWRTLFTAAQTGALAYEAGGAEVFGTRLVWFDRTGQQLGHAGERGAYMDPRVSPDGRRVAVAHGDPQREIWVFDADGSTKTKLTFSTTLGSNRQPAWSPDGRTIAFTANVATGGRIRTAIMTTAAAGGGVERVLVDDARYAASGPSWSPDGKLIAYLRTSGAVGQAVVARPLAGGEATLVVAPASPRSNITQFRISPNGRWVAYSSDESGRSEVYIAPFPRGDGKWQVSPGGGSEVAWGADGKELLFWNNNSQILACPIFERAGAIDIGTPAVLFRANASAVGNSWDVVPDARRLLINLSEESGSTPLHLVVNWTADLAKR